jgi:hypothetical protein
MRRFFTVAIISFASIICCGTTAHRTLPYTLNDAFAGVNLSGRKIIVVMPGDSNIVIHNKNDVIDDYGGLNASPESRIRKYYFPLFFQTLKSFASGDSVFLLDSCKPGLVWDTLCKKELVLKSGMDSKESDSRYRIPEKASVQPEGLDSAVALTIQGIEFKRNKYYIEYYWDEKTMKPANLETNVKVLLWDYAADAPVFYGTITERVKFQFSLNRNHWDESARNLARQILLRARCL